MSDSEPSPPYVEVVGEAEFDEPIETFIAEVTLSVRAAKEETSLQQVGELASRCVERLVGAGLARDEIADGGLDLQRPWWTRRREEARAGKEATRRLLLRSPSLARLTAGLAAIETLAGGQRDTIDVTMKPPVFAGDEAVRTAALRRALAAAREKAQALAEESVMTLGSVLRVEEGSPVQRHSGFAGDQDWHGDAARFGAGMGYLSESGGSESEPLTTPSRTVWVRCRARFELLPPV